MSRAAAPDRLRRVLALIPAIAAQNGDITVGELAEGFGVDREVIEADLAILPLCGLPPYTPDRLIDLAVVGDYVHVRFAEYFQRPLRLTAAEAFALVAAGRALLDIPGSDPTGPLATGLAKLESALGIEEVVDVDVVPPSEVPSLRAAADKRQRVEIDYYSFGRDVMTTRQVDPYAVVSLRGQWYLTAYCHSADDERLFRVDRIHAIRSTGERFQPPEATELPDDVFHPRPGDTRVVLDLPPEARWVVDAYPTETVEERADGRVRVTLTVSERPWLERLLLQLGPDADVVSPPEWQALAAEAAGRVLAALGHR